MSLSQGAKSSLGKLAFGVDEAVEVTGRCRSSIYQAIRDGELKAIKSGRRTLIRTADLEDWVANFTPIEPKNAA
jgi:excisionase family DNA binding protein